MNKLGLALLLLGAASASTTGCGSSEGSPSATAGASYTCPMHPEVKDDEPSACPSCGMKLVEVPKSPAAAPTFTCPMHPEVKDDEPSACPSCGMKLVEVQGSPAAAAAFTCPMHPEVKDDEPSACPSCGMKLVEVQGSAGATHGGGDHVVKISTERQQLIGVKLSEVGEVELTKAIVAAGTLASDENRIVEVPSPVAGVVEEVLGNPIGQQVRKGEPLLVLASEDGTKTTVKATATGHIGWRVNTVGTKVAADYKIATIYDHAGIWVWVEIYETDLPWVKVGQSATMTVPAYPGLTFEGRVTQVSPLLDPRTHTTRVRVDFWNSGFKLKPGMSAVLQIQAPLGSKVAVPESAVIRTGAENIVFVDAGEGRFEVRDVALGVLVGDQYEVVAGLQPGDRIVTRGNFLVDSESKLQGIRAAWSGDH